LSKGKAVAEKLIAERELEGGAGKREGKGGGRLGEIRATAWLLGVQLLLVMRPRKQLRAHVRIGGGKWSAGSHRC
jgi:hypothetical protein